MIKLLAAVSLSLFLTVLAARAVVLNWSNVTWPAGSTSQSYDIDPTNPGNDITISGRAACQRSRKGTGFRSNQGAMGSAVVATAGEWNALMELEADDPSIGLYYGLVLAANGKVGAAKPYLGAAGL